MRVFYALTFHAKSKERIAGLIDDIEKISDKGRFVPQRNLHLTLQFIGESSLSQVETLINLMHEQMMSPPDLLTISFVSSFRKRNNDIVWAGIDENKRLVDFQRKLSSDLNSCHFISESIKYIPHITLGREVILNQPISDVKVNPFQVEIESFSLMESKRSNDKLVYEPVESIIL
ncbi:MAG: RNA 2',3'-cyclic phosphodiesterase [Clostridia bacterium]|nr:RNA 2',3'-cyclic phosphodiesterase [Clostridia bacterium]